MVRISRTATAKRRAGFGRWREVVRRGVWAAAVLLFVFGLVTEASAQAGGGGGGGGGGPGACGRVDCTVDPRTGSTASTSQAAMIDVGSQFLQRAGALLSYRNAGSPYNNPQGGGADTSELRYRTWLEGYGLWSRTDAQGTFTGDRRRTGGGTAGIGATVAPGVNVGLSVDQSRTDIDVSSSTQSGRIDLTQIGAIASFDNGPWNLSTTAVTGFASVRTSRSDDTGLSTAAYDARLWGAMAELSYYVALPDNSRIVPKLTTDWMRSRTNAFTESGGATPISGSAVTASRVRVMIGAEIGHSWLWDRTVMDFLVYGRFVDNAVQNFGDLIINDAAGTSVPSVVSGIRESTLGGDAGATLSAKVTDAVRVYAVYDGRFRSNLTAHTATAGVEVRF